MEAFAAVAGERADGRLQHPQPGEPAEDGERPPPLGLPAAESLAKRIGVDMSKGSISDASNSEGGETSLVFSRKNDLRGDHPITRGKDGPERVQRVQTFTG